VKQRERERETERQRDRETERSFVDNQEVTEGKYNGERGIY